MKIPWFFLFFNPYELIVLCDELYTYRGNARSAGIWKNLQERALVCISENPYDPIIWNTNIEWIDRNAARENIRTKSKPQLSNPIRDTTGISCDFHNDSNACFSKWSQVGATWNVVHSFSEPMGPIFDSRWEDLQEHVKTNVNRGPFKYLTTFDDTGAIVVSIRGLGNAHFLLCTTDNYSEDFCYWIILGGWYNRNPNSGVRRCITGIGNGAWPIKTKDCESLHVNTLNVKNPLKKDEWRTFTITWQEANRTINIYDRYTVILTYTDDQPQLMRSASSSKYYLFYDNPNDGVPKIYRFHNYFYTLVQRPNAELTTQFGMINSNDMCIDMLIGLCADCLLEVSILDGSREILVSSVFRAKLPPSKTGYDLPLWQHGQIVLNNITAYSPPFMISILTKLLGNNGQSKHHWAIADVRECLPEGTTKKASTLAVQDDSHDLIWPNVPCQKLSYDDENEALLNPDGKPKLFYQPSAFTNDSRLCPQSYFGPHCEWRCKESELLWDCSNVVMCDKEACYCPQGFEGGDCDVPCPPGYYGYNCYKKCGSCARKYEGQNVCDAFTGKCSECNVFPNKYLVPPYCKHDEAISAPSSPTVKITEDSVHVFSTIERFENVEASFVFQLRNTTTDKYENVKLEDIHNLNATSKSLNGAFMNLTAGARYSVRLIININKYSLKGDWHNFTTLCQEATEYTAIPDERSITLIKLSNENTLDACPDGWYTVSIFSASAHELKNSSSTFPVNFPNLRSYEEYDIQVMGLDGNVHWKNRTRTLESAPSEVINLRKKDVKSTTATITWLPPVSANGIITGYTIKVQPDYHRGCTYEDSAELNLEASIIIELDENALSYTILNLMPYRSYRISVSAHNSKPGIERTISIETDSIEIPTETWVNLTFSPKNSKLSWSDPDCSTWTGRVYGSKLFFNGISPDVQDFRDEQHTVWHTFELNSTQLQDIHGLETYHVRVHLLHDYKIENFNSEVFVEKNFTTRPSAPPQIRNLTVVEVDTTHQLITLRWKKPLAPTNGHIIRYQIEVPTSYYQRSSFEVDATEACYLWENWICATLNRTYFSDGFIDVRARNEDVVEPGDLSRISNIIAEQVPTRPRNLTSSILENGIVDLNWLHPWTTGIPMKAFRIKPTILATNLSRSLSKAEEDAPSYNLSITTYEKEYRTRMYLLPSTLYEIKVQGVGDKCEGKIRTLQVQTKSSLDFGTLQQPIPNDEESKIDIFIPAMVNDTKDNIMNIILIGPRPCSSSYRLTEKLAKVLELEPSTSAWRIASSPTSVLQNKQFTIGNNKIHDNIANCPLPNGTYEVAFVVHYRYAKPSDEPTTLLRWRSKKIQIGPISKTSHITWIIPLVLVITAAASVTWFYSMKRHQTSTSKRKEPITTPQKHTDSLYRETSLLVVSRESILGESNVGHPPNVALAMEDTNDNDSFSTLVKLKDFQDYVKNGITSGMLNAQYAKLPRGQTKTWNYGQLPENKSKNRYANLIAYDETRVKLDKLPDDPYSDYINANFIKGYQRNKGYIATQGPRPDTLNDFWRMIWQEHVQVICMLANVWESGKKKCEQYWPEIGKEIEFGSITVHNLSHTTFADYTFRTLSVTCNNETRKVEHLHYTAWPDHGVPLYVQSIVTYLKKLLATPVGNGPIVVHCSAGIGRTGTIILCDICLRKAAAQGALDIFAETMAIREQRAKMVDNKQQYLLAHLALVECLLALPTAIPCNDTLPARIHDYKTQLGLQQQSLNESVWQDQALQSTFHKPMEISKNNIHKNRYPELAAVVGPTLHLTRYPTTDNDSDYIFGVYVDSAMRKNDYVATQLPLASTVNDFWRMVAEFNVEVIIVLQASDPKDPTCCEFIPEIEEELHPTPFLNVKGKALIDEDICTNRKILLTDSSLNPGKEQTITVLSLKGWESGPSKVPPKPITLVNFWQYAERIHRGDGPTIVLCYDGVTNSGLYLALNFLLQRMGSERECDVCLAIRAIRRSRPDFCDSRDHFEYLYDTALIYADYFQTYANFT